MGSAAGLACRAAGRTLAVRPLPRDADHHLMTLARPAVVSQTEWDEALAAITEREEAVAAELHQLEADRKRMPMVRVERDYRFEGPDGEQSLSELFDGRSQLILYRFYFEGASAAGPMPGASVARPGPTASPSSACCMLATSRWPWRRRHPAEPAPLRRAGGGGRGGASRGEGGGGGRERHVVLVSPSRRVRRYAPICGRPPVRRTLTRLPTRASDSRAPALRAATGRSG